MDNNLAKTSASCSLANDNNTLSSEDKELYNFFLKKCDDDDDDIDYKQKYEELLTDYNRLKKTFLDYTNFGKELLENHSMCSSSAVASSSSFPLQNQVKMI